MVQVTARIEPRSLEDLNKALEEYATELGKDFQDTVIQQAALLCTDAITLTPPMLKTGGGGASVQAKKTGEGAVNADVNSFVVGANKRSAAFRMYRKLGDACYRNNQSAFDNTIKRSDLSGIKNSIMIKIANDPDHARAFQKARNLFAKFIPSNQIAGRDEYVGDIRPIHDAMKERLHGRRLRKRNEFSGMNWINKYVAMSQDIIKKYIKERQQHVGRLKAGWSDVKRKLPKTKGKAIKFPGGKDPSWITRHGSTDGICSYVLNDRNSSIVLTNKIGDNNNVASEANTKSLVYGLRIKTLTKDLEKQLEARARKFNKQ